MKLFDIFEAASKADVAMDMALFMRSLEFAREDAKSDLDLHAFAERAQELCKTKGSLKMEDYDQLMKSVNKSRAEDPELNSEYDGKK